MKRRAWYVLGGAAAVVGLLVGTLAVWYSLPAPAPQDGMTDEQTKQLLQEIGYLK